MGCGGAGKRTVNAFCLGLWLERGNDDITDEGRNRSGYLGEFKSSFLETNFGIPINYSGEDVVRLFDICTRNSQVMG